MQDEREGKVGATRSGDERREELPVDGRQIGL
jgi:hypothetical protein